MVIVYVWCAYISLVIAGGFAVPIPLYISLVKLPPFIFQNKLLCLKIHVFKNKVQPLLGKTIKLFASQLYSVSLGGYVSECGTKLYVGKSVSACLQDGADNLFKQDRRER